MIDNYKRTFDSVRMSPESQKRIRSQLSSRFEDKKEDNIVSIKPIKKIRKSIVAAVAVMTIIVMAGAAYAYTGGSIFWNLTGGWTEYGVYNEDNTYIIHTFDTENTSKPTEVRDGRIYFVLDGSDTDITDYCSKDSYYSYEQIDDDGYRHVILVGGTADDIGWAEWILDQNGIYVGGTATLYINSPQKPTWLEAAEEEYGWHFSY